MGKMEWKMKNIVFFKQMAYKHYYSQSNPNYVGITNINNLPHTINLLIKIIKTNTREKRDSYKEKSFKSN